MNEIREKMRGNISFSGVFERFTTGGSLVFTKAHSRPSFSIFGGKCLPPFFDLEMMHTLGTAFSPRAALSVYLFWATKYLIDFEINCN